jgi:hypothetical protein
MNTSEALKIIPNPTIVFVPIPKGKSLWNYWSKDNTSNLNKNFTNHPFLELIMRVRSMFYATENYTDNQMEALTTLLNDAEFRNKYHDSISSKWTSLVYERTNMPPESGISSDLDLMIIVTSPMEAVKLKSILNIAIVKYLVNDICEYTYAVAYHDVQSPFIPFVSF